MKVFHKRSSWRRWSKNGIMGANRHFSWSGHTQTYLQQLDKLLSKRHRLNISLESKNRLPTVDRLAFSSIDNALIGNDERLHKLLTYLKRNAKHTGFGLATGRTLDSTLRVLKQRGIAMPDILISSVGTEIHYCHQRTRMVEDINWRRHIDYRWQPRELRSVIDKLAGLRLLPKSQQREHKISYSINRQRAPAIAAIKKELRRHDLHAKLICSEEKNLDVLPIRASKGLAIRYLSMKWGIPLDHIFVAGDSGNDEEMLLGDTLAMVVANHSGELERLKGKSRIYFSKRSHSEGIMEGLAFYDFLNNIRVPEELAEIEKEDAYEQAYLSAGHMISF